MRLWSFPNSLLSIFVVLPGLARTDQNPHQVKSCVLEAPIFQQPLASCPRRDFREPERQVDAGHTPKTPAERWTGPSTCIDQYCTFSNKQFARGRGVVIISTPENVERLKAMEAGNAEPVRESQPFRIKEIKGKGLGLVANKRLRRGDPIMRKAPVVLAHRTVLEHLSPEQFPILDDAIAQLPRKTQEVFMSQLGHFGGHRVNDILATNTFQIDIGGTDGYHYGSFPEISRFNHDCRPNVAFHMDSNLNHITTVVRDVQEGEELTISYLDPFDPRAARQQRTQNAWGFNCGCAACSSSNQESIKSDQRLADIRQIEAQLWDFGTSISPELIKKVIGMYEEERLESKLASVYSAAAVNYNMMANEKLAVKYAKLAVEAEAIENGPGSAHAEDMLLLSKRPREHFTWGRRM